MINVTDATLALLMERSRRNCQVAITVRLCFPSPEDLLVEMMNNVIFDNGCQG